ncbi:hypothetical protein [Sphingomonas nostoxanthinifaciens]|uniref:hypothetical protein n=1 Tax=Sphingomonas nostoxanthinifaciens TaxID=2872652 RepID=UPI001CC1EF0E|nr:hypothetical protein [Sphingomonas nostoxanthinifaciens]UAK25214.1 hypothetical protein K8P63_03160 [Sphingomonas nostoxanthinifaciens]
MLTVTVAAALMMAAIVAKATRSRSKAKGPCDNCADHQTECEQCALDHCGWYAW